MQGGLCPLCPPGSYSPDYYGSQIKGVKAVCAIGSHTMYKWQIVKDVHYPQRLSLHLIVIVTQDDCTIYAVHLVVILIWQFDDI